MSENERKMQDQPKPYLKEMRSYSKISATSSDATIRTDEVVTPELPVVDRMQLPTQKVGRVIPLPFSPSLPLVDSILNADQPTWKLPAVLKPKKTSEQISQEGTQTTGNESYFGLIRNLVKNSGVYALSSMASPLVSLLLLPFLTHTLSHADYGALAVLDTAIFLVSSITILGTDSAFARLYSYECKTKREQLDALSTLTLLLLLVTIPVVVIGVLAAPWLSVLVLGSASYGVTVGLSVVLVLFQTLTVPGMMWMRLEGQATLYSIISIGNFSLVAGATFVLVGILHMGLLGGLVAMGLGNALISFCTLPFIFSRVGFHLHSKMVLSILALGVPFAGNSITLWVLQLADRYLLGHFASLAVAANYAIAYSLGTGASFIISKPFGLAWWVLIYPIARREDASHVFKLIFRGYSFLLLFVTLGLSLFAESILDLLFPAAYHGQSLIISVVAVSTVFSSIFIVFDLGMTLQGKTWLAFIALFFSALLNIGVNVALIPHYGAIGAALATLVAYIALALISYAINQHIYPVPFEVGLFIVALVIGTALFFVDNKLTQGQGDIVILSIHSGLLLFYGGILAVLAWLPSRRN